MLKCANKFQESNPFFNRVLTKDLPSLLNGTLYMGLISTFFSFLACVDCTSSYAHNFKLKCPTNGTNATTPLPEPFLMRHQNIPCWTAAHVPYALLGFWGVTFFLPIGLLAQGMNQVLFQQESLDIKYAPVVMLFSQLIKALASAARAFFTFNVELLASLALAGNVLLFLIMTRPWSDAKSASLWYIQYIKSGIYAASGWSAAVAIYRIKEKKSSSIASNLVYMGWLAIGALTATAIRLRVWRRDEQKIRDEFTYSSSQRALVSVSSTGDTKNALTPAERRLIHAAAAATQSDAKVQALLREAERLADAATEPTELLGFMNKARAFASGRQVATSMTEAVFMQNARKLARKMDRNTVDVDAAVTSGSRLNHRRQPRPGLEHSNPHKNHHKKE